MVHNGWVWFYALSSIFVAFLFLAYICEQARIFDKLVLFAYLIADALLFCAGAMCAACLSRFIFELDIYRFSIGYLFYFGGPLILLFNIPAAIGGILAAERCYFLYEAIMMNRTTTLSITDLQRFIGEVVAPQFPKHTDAVVRYFVLRCKKYARKNGLRWEA